MNVYDLSPANEFLWPVGFGLHHSGVEIMGTEYSFASGGGIFECSPKEAAGAQFRVSMELGAYDGGQAEMRKAIADLRDDFGPDDYNLIRKNCNTFANALVYKLLGKGIPAYVNRLADIGFCCSCLLPKSLIEHAPVGDPTGSSSSGGGRALAPSKKQVTPVFTGKGATLGGAPTTTSGGGGLLGSLRASGSSNARTDDLTDRREKARAAALARMEQAQRGNNETSDTDKSR